MTKAQLLFLVAVLAIASITTGVALQWGASWALMVGGLLALGGAVVLYDPSEKRPV